MHPIVINGSFYKRSLVTGIARYGREITARLLQYSDVVVAMAKQVSEVPADRTLTGPRLLSSLNSKIWNQLVLPAVVGRKVLWTPEGIGPLGIANQIPTIHDLAVLEHPEWFQPDFVATYRYYLPRLARQAKFVLTVSEFSRTQIIERFGLPPERVCAVPNAVSQDFHPRSAEDIAVVRSRYGLPQQYILTVCSLEPRKNLANLLRAWQFLAPADRAETSLVIAGEKGKVFADPRFDSLLSKVEDVLFTGYFPEADLPSLYSGAVAMVYPSLYEGFGMPLLEAMACGTPVITCKNTSLPEVVGECALFCEPHDPESIAAALVRALSDSNLRKHLRDCALSRAAMFSWDISSRKIYEILNTVRANG